MASDGIHGHGTTLTGASTGVIGNIQNISGPNQSRDSIDISTMDSPAKWKEFIPAMLDAGEITFDVNYDPVSGQTANDLNTALTADPEVWTIAIKGDASTYGSWACSGFVTGLGFAIPFDGKVTQSVTIKFSGAPTYTDAT